MSLKNKDAMIAAIAKEIMLTELFEGGEIIETIYFGGGTPSLLNAGELQLLLNKIREKFSVKTGAEITLEANPDNINGSALEEWQRAGINRLSVGLQSFNEAELKWMNRAHNAAQSLLCLDDIRHAGFTDYSVDLIYGSPMQTDEDLRNNFNILLQRNVPHISCYALTVEEGTVLNKLIKEKKSPGTDPEKQSEQFHLLLKLMEEGGYEQYEISNFCKPGHRSRHNSSYWQGKPYYGFGPSAHSFDGVKTRKWNIANNSLYNLSLEKNLIPAEEEVLTDEQRLNEYIMTSLRTADGLDLVFAEENFGKANTARITTDAEKYLKNKKMMRVENVLLLTQEGKFFADGIAADLFLSPGGS